MNLFKYFLLTIIRHFFLNNYSIVCTKRKIQPKKHTTVPYWIYIESK